MSKYKLHHGNCLDYMKSMPNNYVDAIVTDPPYGLKFMGKKWDYDVPSVEIWEECYRILKPGGHLLSFAGTRTYHRLVIKIEDAGFEIRDMIAWIYGQGFPKSLNVGKTMDKYLKTGNASWNGTGDSSNGALGYTKLQFDQGYRPDDYSNRHQTKTEISEDEAKQWDGWGTALKPAIEPICLARKPLEGSVVKNILKYGVGGINIDGCRVPIEGEVVPINKLEEWSGFGEKIRPDYTPTINNKGRFPANVIHDGSEVIVKEFPQSTVSGSAKNGKPATGTYPGGFGGYAGIHQGTLHNDSGSAARFFYCAKASKKDRDEGLEDLEEVRRGAMSGNVDDNNNFLTGSGNPRRSVGRNTHPTVKTTLLMRYLCKLITPPNGIVIDPFMGSGSTGKACRIEGFRFIGIELDEGYFEIAKRRVANAEESE